MEVLKNKKVLGIIVSLLLAGLSAAVGYNVKDQVCGADVKAEAVEVKAEASPAK